LPDRLRTHPWKAISVGDETDSICTRCKDETIHRVVAIMEGKVHLVICTRCNSQHRYRPSLATMKRRVPLPSERQARVLKKVASAQASHLQTTLKEWQRLQELAEDKEPLSYDLSFSYQKYQPVAHPTFGLGFVRRIIDPSKIEVVFEREVKILVMNRPKSE